MGVGGAEEEGKGCSGVPIVSFCSVRMFCPQSNKTKCSSMVLRVSTRSVYSIEQKGDSLGYHPFVCFKLVSENQTCESFFLCGRVPYCHDTQHTQTLTSTAKLKNKISPTRLPTRASLNLRNPHTPPPTHRTNTTSSGLWPVDEKNGALPPP